MNPNPIRVLVVEDEHEDALLLESQYLQNGIRDGRIRIHHVTRFDTALACLRKETFQVVLLDLHLPDKGGFAAIQYLAQTFPELPVIAMTGLPEDEATGLQALQVGAQDFISKGEMIGLGGAVFGRSIRYAIERKRAGKILKRSEARNRAIVAALPDLLLIQDREGNYLDIKAPESDQLFTAAVVGRNMRDILPGEIAERIRETFEVARATRELQELEYALGIHGKEHHFECRITLYDEDKFLSIVRDITVRREMENSLMHAFVEGQEKERKRIAEELHDGIGPLLSTVKLNLEMLAGEDSSREFDRQRYENARSLLNAAANELRDISHNLMPSGLLDFGLKAALADLCTKIQATSKFALRFNALDADQRLVDRVELALYRIAQELLNNIIKHAQPQEVTLQLIRRDGKVLLMAEDDGVGFPATRDGYLPGLGLKNIEARVKALDGKFVLDSSPGGGTLISIEIPVPTS